MYNQEGKKEKKEIVMTISVKSFQRLINVNSIAMRGRILIIGISKTSRLIVKQKLHG